MPPNDQSPSRRGFAQLQPFFVRPLESKTLNHASSFWLRDWEQQTLPPVAASPHPLPIQKNAKQAFSRREERSWPVSNKLIAVHHSPPLLPEKLYPL